MAAVAGDCERQIGPQEFVDRIEILNRVLDLRIVRAHIHRRAGQKTQRLVEAAMVGPRRIGFAQMPLA